MCVSIERERQQCERVCERQRGREKITTNDAAREAAELEAAELEAAEREAAVDELVLQRLSACGM